MMMIMMMMTKKLMMMTIAHTFTNHVHEDADAQGRMQ